MKKLLIVLAVFAFAGVSKMQAQTLVPADCQNFGLLMGKVQNNEALGFTANSFTTDYIAYLIQPDPPYLAGTMTITFVPNCEPLEPCPKILKIEQVDIWILKDDGTCQYREQAPGN